MTADKALETEIGKAQWRRSRSAAVMLLLVFALFSGVVAGALIVTTLGNVSPAEAPTLKSLGGLLQKSPQNEELKQAYRIEDQRERENFFARRRRAIAGGWLLLAGLALTLICAKWCLALDQKKPAVPEKEVHRPPQRWRIIGIGAGGAAVLAALAIAGLTGEPKLSLLPKTGALIIAEKSEPPAANEVQEKNWPRFRGPDGNGIAPEGNWPRQWDALSGTNILWKSPVPLQGNSSPVVWRDKIFLTGADAEKQELFCFNANSGKLIWRIEVAAERGEVRRQDIKVLPENGYASPTAATDGRLVFATFASGDVAAVDFDGNVVWARNLGKPESAYGRATSLIEHAGKVFVQFDRGSDPEDGLSSILALDAETGKTLWSAPRAVRASWCTPVVARIGAGFQLIAGGSPLLAGYDVETGKELWRFDGIGADVAASPIFANGTVFMTNETSKLFAVKPGSGDISASGAIWTGSEGLSDTSSPVADENYLFQANSRGQVTCYNVKTGKLLWEKDVEASVWASLTIAGNAVYVPAEDGKVYLFEPADQSRIIATCDLGEPLRASPAFCNGRIYFRGRDNLFCIGNSAGE